MSSTPTSDPTPASRSRQPPIVRYLARLSLQRYILWCYFIYWLVIVVHYFDARPQLWLTSLGLSLIIGFALYTNTRSGQAKGRLGAWATFRLFVTPFCVSSFAALVKDRGFILIFSPNPWPELAIAITACAAMGAAALTARRL